MKFPIKSAFLMLLLTALAVVGIMSVSASSGTVLAVNPPVVSAGVGTLTSAGFTLSDATNAQGIDVQFSFNPSVLQVVDADGVTAGIQVAPGDCPAPDLVLVNDVDNGAGTGQYAAVEFTTSCSGGDVLAISFQCAAPGSSSVTITSSLISDPNGTPIQHSVTNGTVNCQSNIIFLPLAKQDP